MKKTFIKKGIFTCIAAILGVASSFAQTVNTGTVTPTAICVGGSFTVVYTTSAAVAGTPTFSVELSDATGTFPTTPNVIGTGTASPLSATIPAGTPAGAAYKVRVTAPSPIVTGTPSAAVTVNTAPSAPVVATPLDYTVGETGNLTATAISGATLNWYGTAATGGTASATKPVPSTTTVGTTTYYVSQTIGTCESPRSAIVVNVAA
ncbi:Ig-like domain-containing protein, partial [Dyadobacter koreensis]